jgi:hypothetical protein
VNADDIIPAFHDDLMAKTITITPSLAVKATRGTARIWTKNGRFGAGDEPASGKRDWPSSLLKDVAADLLGQGYSLSITQHD